MTSKSPSSCGTTKPQNRTSQRAGLRRSPSAYAYVIMVVDIEPHVRARVEQLVAQVGEAAFRRGVAQMTRWDTEIRSLNDVICLYVLARRGRVAPPELGQRAVEAYPTLPGRTDDDLGFRDPQGRAMTPDQYVQWRTDLRAGTVTA